jgi:ribosome-binding factor A
METGAPMGKSRRDSEKRSRGRRDSEGGRTVRLQELIREELNYLLRCEVTDARLQGVAVTFVQLAGDGSCARLWFTAEGEQDRTETLERAAGFFRGHLVDSLALKRTPELRFRRDPATRAFAAPDEEVM